jgi:hypothetical protein
MLKAASEWLRYSRIQQRKCYTCCRIVYYTNFLSSDMMRIFNKLRFGMMNAFNYIKILTNKKETCTMKKMTLLIAAGLVLAAPAAFAAMEHDHGSMNMEPGGHMMGNVAHEEVVDGVKATFSVLDIKTKMKEMGMKETHHIMVMFTDAKSGKQLGEGEVSVKVQGPDKSEQVKELMGMEGGFGSDFTMPQTGKYGIMAKSKLKDGKVRSVKFWYTAK